MTYQAIFTTAAAVAALKVAIALAVVVAIVYTVKYFNRKAAIKSKISIGASFPILSTKDGRYLYKAILNGNAATTKLVKIEVLLDKQGSYYKTSRIYAGSISEDWRVSSNEDEIKSGIGSETDRVVLYFDMDGATIATSYAKTILKVYVKYDFDTFFKTFHLADSFDFEVPGPYRDVETPWADLNWRYSGIIITNNDLEDWTANHIIVGND